MTQSPGKALHVGRPDLSEFAPFYAGYIRACQRGAPACARAPGGRDGIDPAPDSGGVVRPPLRRWQVDRTAR